MKVRVLRLDGFQSDTLDGAIDDFYKWRDELQDETFVDILMDIGSSPKEDPEDTWETEETKEAPVVTLLIAYTR